jgi:cellulose synthase (UDP-forming)
MNRVRKLHSVELCLLLLAGAIGIACIVLTVPTGELLAGAINGWAWLRAQFSVVNTSTPLLRVLLPAIVCGALVYGVMLIDPRPARVTRAAVIVLLVALYTAYMAFRLFATLNLSTLTAAVFSALFFLAELLIYLKSLATHFQMFWPTNRSPDATRLSEPVTAGRYLPDVDIFLPSYSEPSRCCVEQSSGARRCAIRGNRFICSTISADRRCGRWHTNSAATTATGPTIATRRRAT